MRRADGSTGLYNRQKNSEVVAHLVPRAKKLVIVVTHNAALKDMADKVIRIKSGKIESVEVNAHPIPVEAIEW